MKGDFSRLTFRPERAYTSVRLQQGRVLLDADWNEQMDIQTSMQEAQASVFIGTSGTPRDAPGFQIALPAGSGATAPLDLSISPGRYYVGGMLCELRPGTAGQGTSYLTQPNLPAPPPLSGLPAGIYLCYLDVFTRHVTAIEDPLLRDPALNGLDTATRVQTVWQVKLQALPSSTTLATAIDFSQLLPPSSATLQARSAPATTAGGAAGYQGLSNQLYRVEIHQGGTIGSASPPTFKWSRDNGAVVAAWLAQNGNDLTVSTTGRDSVLGFAIGQWLELLDDTLELGGRPGPLVQIVNITGNVLTVDPAGATLNISSFPLNPRVRRWDMAAAALPVPAGSGPLPVQAGQWIALENGVQVLFSGTTCQTGDYWVIPARTATQDVMWPSANGQPAALSPRGICHHYAALAQFQFDGKSVISALADRRFVFPSLCDLVGVDPVHFNQLIQTHTHTGTANNDGTPIPRGGIANNAVDGTKIDPTSTVTVQRLNATGGWQAGGACGLNANPLYMTGDGTNDTHHGIGYFGTPNLNFANTNVGGTVVFGYSGGALGSTSGGQKIALQWDSNQTVTLPGTLTAHSLTVSTPSTLSGGFSAGASCGLNNNPLYLRGNGTSDSTHGIGYFGTSTNNVPLFAGTSLDGVVVFGYSGGALGSTSGSQKIALQWDNSQNVTLPGTLTAHSLTVNTPSTLSGGFSAGASCGLNSNVLYLRGTGTTDSAHGIGYYASNFAGASVDGPVVFGNSGGALGSTSGGQKIALQWDSNQNVTLEGVVNLPFNGNVSTSLSTAPLAGLSYFGAAGLSFGAAVPITQFAGTNINGPLLFGWIGGALGTTFGGQKIALQWDTSQNVTVLGTLTATNLTCTASTKKFQISHPLDPERRHLVHACIEGPEAGVYYRGEAQLENGTAAITLPAYFEALTRKDSRTVLLTPCFEDDEPISQLAASAVRDGGFRVRAVDRNNPAQRFYWEVKAVRGDIAPLEVEPSKTPAAAP